MGDKYRLKQNVGTHRRPSPPLAPNSNTSPLGEVVEPGQVFEPTPAELKAFGHKFEPAHEKPQQPATK